MPVQTASPTPALVPNLATPLAVEFAVEPFEDGRVLYQRIAPTAEGEPERMMLYFMATVTNNTGAALRLKGVEVTFPGTKLAPVLYQHDEELPPGTREVWLHGDHVIGLTKFPASVRIRLLFDDGRDAWRVWPLAAHATSYAFFARPESNPDYGECLVLPGRHHKGGGSQHFGYDVGVLGRNRIDGTLSAHKTNLSTNADTFLWERPFYAMADGVVLRAVDEHPDNPSPDERMFVRKSGAYESPYEITAVAATYLGAGKNRARRTAVAAVTDAGALRLAVLEQTQDGNALSLVAEASGPDAAAVSVAAPDSTHVLTASRVGTTATLTLWHVPAGGTTVAPLDSVRVPGVADVKVVALTADRALTVARTPAGTLALAVWSLKGGTVHPAPLGTGAAGAVTEFEVVALDAGTRAVTAVRQADGQLKLIAWDLKPGLAFGVPVVRRGDVLGGPVAEVALSTTAVAGQVTAAARAADGSVRLTTWDVDAAGAFVARGTVTSDGGSMLQLAFFKTNSLAAAFRTPAGNLGVVAWNASQDDETKVVTHKRLYAQGAGPVDRLAVTRVPTDQPTIVTAVRTAAGRLKVILWQYTDSNSIAVLYGNEVVYHVHLRQGSIPDALLADAPVPVKRGDLLGRMGHSGKSSGPHLHIHAARVRPELLGDLAALRARVVAGESVGPFRPLQFHGVQGVRRAGAKPGAGEANPVTTFAGHGAYFEPYAVWPSVG